MIRFVCGRSGSGKSEYVMEALRRDYACGESVLIVPEQQAVVWESRIARELPSDAALNVEVLTFTRLCDKVFRQYGGFLYNCATKQSKRLLMWAALESVRGTMGYYNTARSERLVPALLKTVKELRTYRVDPSRLEQAAKELDSGDAVQTTLSRKLYDISAVYAAYDKLLSESFSDSDEMLERTAKIIAENKFFRGKRVFLDSFYSYTPAQRDVIMSAMRDASELTMTFSCPSQKTAEPQFAHIRQYFDRMRSVAGGYGGCEIISLTEQKRFRSPAIGIMESGIWDFSKKEISSDHNGISLVFTKDRYDEGDAVASVISRLVRDGVRYSDIAVIARSTESLEGITDAALQRKGIPFYTTRRRKLEHSSASVLVTASLRAAAYGWRREDIISIAKTGLIGITEDDCAIFEKYVNMWRIRGERAFTGDGDFGMDPFGYKDAPEERSQEILDRVNCVRRKLCDPLSAFCEIFSGKSATARECARGLYKLLCDWSVPDAISERAANLRELGYKEESAEFLRMWDALMSILDTLATTIPDAKGDGESLAVMVSQIISATDVGTIPTGIDQVALGGADMMRTENPRHVIIIGAVDGEFPAGAPSEGILSETDRVMLEGCGIELSDSGRNASGMELFWFYKAVSSPSESVTVIVPRQSGGSLCTPSMGVTRIRELFPGLSPEEYNRDDPEVSVWVKEDLDRFLRLENSIGNCARSLVPDGDSILTYGDDRSYDSSLARIDPVVIREKCGGILGLSQTKLDAFAKCPFSYCMNHTIGIAEDSSAQINQSDTGSLVHKILELFFRETADMEFPIPADVEEKLTDRLFDDYVEALREKGATSGRQRFLFSRLRRSIGVFIRSLNEEFTQGKFRPWQFEKHVGDRSSDDIPPPSIYLADGTKINMSGDIDRIDVYRDGDKTYVRVVDYKTGSKEFRLEDIYDGFNLQLLLYLFAIWKSPDCSFRESLSGSGEVIPAGALYFSAKPGESTAGDMLYGDEGFGIAVKNVSRTGIVLADMGIIEAMDRDLTGKYAPVKFSSKGEIKNPSAMATVEKFDEICSDITDVITRIGEEICCGNAAADPKAQKGKKLPCTYCGYYPVCRKDTDSDDTDEVEGE